jgi:hypothetical protein
MGRQSHDHALIDKWQYSSIINVWPFRGAHCDTDHYLAILKDRERLSIHKWAVQKIDTERFNIEN